MVLLTGQGLVCFVELKQAISFSNAGNIIIIIIIVIIIIIIIVDRLFPRPGNVVIT